MGYTMQATIAAWLMATLTPSAIMVALVQTASTVPTLLFGLLAGALADIVDRRKVILVTQFVLIAATAALGVAELLGVIGPVALLALDWRKRASARAQVRLAIEDALDEGLLRAYTQDL